jgi:hypothetical protein
MTITESQMPPAILEFYKQLDSIIAQANANVSVPAHYLRRPAISHRDHGKTAWGRHVMTMKTARGA